MPLTAGLNTNVKLIVYDDVLRAIFTHKNI